MYTSQSVSAIGIACVLLAFIILAGIAVLIFFLMKSYAGKNPVYPKQSNALGVASAILMILVLLARLLYWGNMFVSGYFRDIRYIIIWLLFLICYIFFIVIAFMMFRSRNLFFAVLMSVLVLISFMSTILSFHNTYGRISILSILSGSFPIAALYGYFRTWLPAFLAMVFLWLLTVVSKGKLIYLICFCIAEAYAVLQQIMSIRNLISFHSGIHSLTEPALYMQFGTLLYYIAWILIAIAVFRSAKAATGYSYAQTPPTMQYRGDTITPPPGTFPPPQYENLPVDNACICRNCEKKNPAGAMFCAYCGAQISSGQ